MLTLFPTSIKLLSQATGLAAVGTSQSGEWMCTQQVVRKMGSILLNFKSRDHLTTVETTGCHSLVGNNWLSLNSRVAMATPLPQDRIQCQPGDVIGFYVENNHGGDRGVVVVNDLIMQGDRQYTSEEVWHADISSGTFGNLECPYPVGSSIPGSLRVLTNFINVAPVISVAYSKSIVACDCNLQLFTCRYSVYLILS